MEKIFDVNNLEGFYPKIKIENNLLIKKYTSKNEKEKEFLLNYAYTHFYLSNIYYLINEASFKYEWINFINTKVDIPNHTCNSFQTENNPFVSDSKDDLKKLSEDILQNGIYTPFYLKKYRSDGYSCDGGKHRIYSLLLNQEKSKDKSFLCLITPPEYSIANLDDIVVKRFSTPIQSGLFQNNSLITFSTDNIKTYFKAFKHFSESIGFFIYPYKESIKPLLVFNDEKLFEDFINNEKFTSN